MKTITLLLSLISFNALASKSFSGTYYLDTFFKSDKKCPPKISLSRYRFDYVQMFLESGELSNGTKVGKFVDFNVLEDRSVQIAKNIYGDTIKKSDFKKNGDVLRVEALRDYDGSIIWQIRDYKKKKNSRTCFYTDM